MPLRPNDLARDLARGLKPVYLISGDELLLVEEACDAIIAAARAQGFTERDLIQVETGYRWSELTEASRAMSLFSQRRLLDVRVPAKRFDKDAGDVLIEYCRAPPTDTLLLLRTERLESKQRGAAWFKAIDRAGAVMVIWPIELNQLQGWLSQRCRAADLALTADALEYLATRVEGNLLAAVQEIEKLKLLGLAQPVTLEMLMRAITDAAHFDAFDLMDAALTAQPSRVRHVIWVLRAEGVAPLLVLGVLAAQLRRLLSGDSRGLPQGRERAMRAARARFSLVELETLLKDCCAIDQQSKGALGGDVWQSLERATLRLAGIESLDQLNRIAISTRG